MSKELNISMGQHSAWGTASLVIFLAAAAYSLFAEHRAHLWIALSLLAVCLAMIVALWRTADGDRHKKDASSPNYGSKKRGVQ